MNLIAEMVAVPTKHCRQLPLVAPLVEVPMARDGLALDLLTAALGTTAVATLDIRLALGHHCQADITIFEDHMARTTDAALPHHLLEDSHGSRMLHEFHTPTTILPELHI
jgi:hypothetical protein